MNSSLIISLDFELLWGLSGWNENQIAKYAPHIQGSVFALESILKLFSEYNIKCTIAYVGAMSCDSKKQLLCLKKDLPEPSYKSTIFSSYNSIDGDFVVFRGWDVFIAGVDCKRNSIPKFS